MRKQSLKLVTPEAGAGSSLPQTETTPQPTQPPAPAPAPAVGGGGTEAEPPDTAIGVGCRVVDSAGTLGEIIARNAAWLTMRTDAGEERNVRKQSLKLVTPEAGSGRARRADEGGGLLDPGPKAAALICTGAALPMTVCGRPGPDSVRTTVRGPHVRPPSSDVFSTRSVQAKSEQSFIRASAKARMVPRRVASCD